MLKTALATCSARLQRTRDVERDTLLKTALSEAPPNTTSVWLRGYTVLNTALWAVVPNTTLRGCEVRMEAAPTAVEASVRSVERKRSRRGTSLAEEAVMGRILGSLTI